MTAIAPATLDFLRDLAANNDRDWFAANKARYEAARENLVSFSQALIDGLRKTDMLDTLDGKKSLFRIYRDTRFSKNKTPYKINLGGSYTRTGKLLRGGYYFSIQPGGESVIGGGFYGPERDDLLRIRQEIERDAAPLRKIIGAKDFKKHFSTLAGDTLKTAPKGFDRDHPDIDLLRYKNFYATRTFSDAEVTAENFGKEALSSYIAIRPFFDYMSEVLTTDANGEVIV
ncbi:MAG: DUF2461 domain-containing protein [Saprospiraceae bacterium]